MLLEMFFSVRGLTLDRYQNLTSKVLVRPVAEKVFKQIYPQKTH